MTVLLVDWLGRGGIAHTTRAWALELERAGADPLVVTRAGRELATQDRADGVDTEAGRVRQHRDLATRAASLILERRPTAVVVQNYVIPPLEGPVFEAARDVGARLVLVVHDHRMHAISAGTNMGLRHLMRRADVVVAHSEFVASALSKRGGRPDVRVVPLPVQLGMFGAPRPVDPVVGRPPDGRSLALHFGVLRRRYKGTDVVEVLARAGVPGWSFAFLGTGAPVDVPGAVSRREFLEAGVLVDAVERSDATILPYRLATQSGAVVLAQVAGSVVVASAVGGIPEQITHGRTGFLVTPGSPASRWAEILDELSDARRRAEVAEEARRRAWQNHAQFVAAALELVRRA